MEEDTLQDCMTIWSNGVSLEDWSMADAIKAIYVWVEMDWGSRQLQDNVHESSRKAKPKVDSDIDDWDLIFSFSFLFYLFCYFMLLFFFEWITQKGKSIWVE